MYPRNSASPQRVALGAVVAIADGAVQTSGVSVSVLPHGTTASAGGGTLAFEQGIAHYTPTQAETNYTSFIVIAYKTGSIPVSVTVVTSASATAGYAGVDWGFVANPTTAVNLSATNIDVDQVVASVTGAVGSVTGNVGGNVTGSVGSVASGGITAASLAADAITAAKLAADVTTELQSGLATASALSTVAGLIAAVETKVDTAITDIAAVPTAIENADALLARDIGSGTGAGTLNERTVRSALRFLRNKWSISGTTLTVTKENDTDTSHTATVTPTTGADPVTGVDPS